MTENSKKNKLKNLFQLKSNLSNNNSKVLTCPSCKKIFTKFARIPYNLKCNHIICKECILNKGICSIDKKIIDCDIKDLTINQTFLDFIPSKKVFLCKCKETIKFMCSFDNETFCSNCLKNHENKEHSTFVFYPKINNILNDLENIKIHSKEKLNEIEIKLDNLSDLKINLIDKTKNEFNKLNENFEILIKKLKKIKENYENEIKNSYFNQINKINNDKEIISNNKKILNEIFEGINYLISKCENEDEIIYDDLIKNKNEIIQKWELSLKNSVYNCNLYNFEHLKIPSFKFNFDSNILNEIIMLKNDNNINRNNLKNNIDNNNNYFLSRESTNAYTKQDSCLSNQKKNFNNSEKKQQNKLFFVDTKTENKPVLINNNNNKTLIYDNNNKENNNIYNSNKLVYRYKGIYINNKRNLNYVINEDFFTK
jgi:hypothetical protein